MITSSSQPPKQYKMTTPIPPGIASPDEVETRLGTLHFSDGCPDKATAETLNDKKWPFLVNRIEREGQFI